VRNLGAMLASHEIPVETDAEWRDPPRPREIDAPCVHTGVYGTRSSAIVIVPPDDALPHVRYSDGPPCTNPYLDATAMWGDAG
jgi:hypothetical protein